jgi:hypothetical protein
MLLPYEITVYEKRLLDAAKDLASRVGYKGGEPLIVKAEREGFERALLMLAHAFWEAPNEERLRWAQSEDEGHTGRET